MDEAVTTQSSAPSPWGSLGRLPVELRLTVAGFLDHPPIPSRIGPTSKSIGRMTELRALNKTWNDFVSKNQTGFVTLLLDEPRRRNAHGITDADVDHRDTVVRTLAARVIRNTADTTLELFDDAIDNELAYENIGKVVLDGRISLKKPDHMERLNWSERYLQQERNKLFTHSSALCNAIHATLHVEADIPSPLDLSLTYFTSRVPQDLTWNGQSIDIPDWSAYKIKPLEYVNHTYSLDFTLPLLSRGDPARWGRYFRPALSNAVRLYHDTTSKDKASSISFHLWVDQTNQAAVNNFAEIPFDQMFTEEVPEELRTQGNISLQLNGESPIPALPYDVVGKS